MIGRQGLSLIGMGTAIGYAIAIPLGHIAKSFLYGVQTLNGWTYASVAGLLCLVGICASFVPVHRAISIEPMRVLLEGQWIHHLRHIHLKAARQMRTS